MVRPKKCRHLHAHIPCSLFKPNGIRACELEKIILNADEFEALSLADVQGLSHIDAAKSMGVSRQTLSNLLASGRNKTASAITLGKALLLPKGETNE